MKGYELRGSEAQIEDFEDKEGVTQFGGWVLYAITIFRIVVFFGFFITIFNKNEALGLFFIYNLIKSLLIKLESFIGGFFESV